MSATTREESPFACDGSALVSVVTYQWHGWVRCSVALRWRHGGPESARGGGTGCGQPSHAQGR